MSQVFKQSVVLPISAQECFDWHERPGAFERLCPPWDPVHILHKDPHIRDDARVVLKVKALPGIQVQLEARHKNYQHGVSFEDYQVKGPFAEWVHTHHMQDHEQEGSKDAQQSDEAQMSNEAEDSSIISPPNQCTLTDHIQYSLPLGALGQWGGGNMVRQRLNQLFHYRHQVMLHDVQLHALAQGRTLTIAVSGARGLIGNALCALLTTGGHQVIRLVRRLTGAPDERLWETPDQVPDLSDVDAVVHLAGENVAQRWSKAAKDRIMQSRVTRTQALAQALATYAQNNPSCKTKTFIVASGIGYYGHSSEQVFDESAPLGEGFLASVCQAWENASMSAQQAGIRVVTMRIGIVLSPTGGALAKLLLPFKAGIGGPVADGQQWMSWISLHDVVGALYFALLQDEVVGVVNAVAPHAVRNKEFSQVLAKVIQRPCLFPVPAFVLKMLYGEMAKETVLTSQHVVPKQLQKLGYPFMHENLENSLRFLLGKEILNMMN